MKYFLLFLFLALIGITGYGQNQKNIDLLFQWKDSTLVPSSAFDNTYNEVWGYASNGKEYAIIGSSAGTHIFDITDPINSYEAVFIPGTAQGSQIIHRDYHDFQDYLYIVCDEGNSALQIADLRFLPDSAPVVYESDTLFMRAHNIFIDTATAKLYVCGNSNTMMALYSLADPLNPTLLVNCAQDVPFWGSMIGYVHDVYVLNDTAYCNAGLSGFYIVDFIDPPNPIVVGSMTQYLQQGYNHSGWLDPERDLYALADETHGKDLKMLDVSDLLDINVVDTFDSKVDSLSIPHNLIFKDEYLYVSYYHDGLYIYNTCNPSNNVITGFYDTSQEPHATTYKGAWGVFPYLPSGLVLVSDMQEGLFVLDVSKSLLALTPTKQDVSCFGEADGQATVMISGAGRPFNYQWDNQQIDSLATGLTAGIYTVTLSDTNNCSNEITIQVDEPDEIDIAIFTQNVSMNGGNDGSAIINVTGGTTPYQFDWSSPSGGLNLSAGTYSVIITDSNNCMDSITFTISEPQPTGINAEQNNSINIYPNPFLDNLDINLNKPTAYKILHPDGRLLMSGDLDARRTTLELEDLPSGLYILYLDSGDMPYLKKLLKL